ncbi:hypothetical protein [Usitatibacter palustris]|uniref:Uncharacterized protein n=1 Tax=Usitatibacter palustris TaxID=2732487 RepID=A0A6M4H1S8_9PROT|nr:hypothetical protein [Usitatibacter palustris]QJR13410.1 hypothetical protein DSM104440_00193 [Usitatibacter palustris]
MIRALRLFTLIALAVAAGGALADRSAYNAVVTLEAKGEGFKVLHEHDWSVSGRRTASVSWIAADGKVERKVPSPALTWLGVSEDSRYVIGLSTVRLDNPEQMAVWTRDGQLVAQRRISARVACLTQARYEELRSKHPKGFEALGDRVWSSGAFVYVDFLATGMPEKLGPLWGELLGHGCASPFSPDISESVTNWIFWFDAQPAPEVIESAGKPVALRLRDTKGSVMTIPFQLGAPRAP